jgi:hypothetical protein
MGTLHVSASRFSLREELQLMWSADDETTARLALLKSRSSDLAAGTSLSKNGRKGLYVMAASAPAIIAAARAARHFF